MPGKHVVSLAFNIRVEPQGGFALRRLRVGRAVVLLLGALWEWAQLEGWRAFHEWIDF